MYRYVYMYVCIYICIHVYIERDSMIRIHTMCVYIHICVNVSGRFVSVHGVWISSRAMSDRPLWL